MARKVHVKVGFDVAKIITAVARLIFAIHDLSQ